MTTVIPEDTKKRLNQIRARNISYIDCKNHLIGISLDKLQEGDYNYDTQPKPAEETLGYYAKQLRERLGV